MKCLGVHGKILRWLGHVEWNREERMTKKLNQSEVRVEGVSVEACPCLGVWTR